MRKCHYNDLVLRIFTVTFSQNKVIAATSRLNNSYPVWGNQKPLSQLYHNLVSLSTTLSQDKPPTSEQDLSEAEIESNITIIVSEMLSKYIGTIKSSGMLDISKTVNVNITKTLSHTTELNW